MALPTPSINDIAAQIVADIESKTNQTIPPLAKSVFNVMAFALAGVWIILYKYGSWAFNQIFPQLADETFLQLLGENKRVTRTPAVAWQGQIEIGVKSNTDLQAGSQLVNNATGVIYLTTAVTSITTPTHILDVISVTQGEIGNLQDAQEINFVNPLPNVERRAIVDSTTLSGADKED